DKPGHDKGGRILGADALDFRAATDELFLEPLEAAVEMIDAVDHGLAFGGKSRDDERYRCTQVGRHHRSALQSLDALDRGGIAVELNLRAKPRQFLHVHKTVLENCLGDM